MSEPRRWWILKTPGSKMIFYDEPLNMDWSVCKKTEVIEASGYDRLAARLEEAEKIIWEAASTAKYFDKCWDISDVSNIQIKTHGKETQPNDSLAGGSILRAFDLGKRAREYFEKHGDGG